MGTYISEDRERILNFLAFVPAPSQSPLYVTDAKSQSGVKDVKSGFEIPGWGGITVYNRDASLGAEINEPELENLCQHFVAQIRNLIGAPAGRSGTLESFSGATFLPARKEGIASWELDVLLKA